MNPVGGHPNKAAIRNLASKNSTPNVKSFSHQKSLVFIPKKFSQKRIPFAEREKAAYLILRRAGLSINQISKAFGRSTSLIFRVLKKRRERGHFIPRFDMRKLPYKIRMRMASFRWHKMLTLLSQWISWVCGEGDKPP